MVFQVLIGPGLLGAQGFEQRLGPEGAGQQRAREYVIEPRMARQGLEPFGVMQLDQGRREGLDLLLIE